MTSISFEEKRALETQVKLVYSSNSSCPFSSSNETKAPSHTFQQCPEMETYLLSKLGNKQRFIFENENKEPL